MKIKNIIKDLRKHSSFIFLSTLIVVIIIFSIEPFLKISFNKNIFHILHPLHIFILAFVISALFFNHKKKPLLALLIGMISSIILASLSDIILPWYGGLLFNLNTSFNLLLLKTPFLIISTSLIGGLIGLETKIDKMPRFIHIFISVFASAFYLFSFSIFSNNLVYLIITLIIFVSVSIVCCISDIIFPSIFRNE